MTRAAPDGPVRINLWCHDCRNDFSADLDYGLNGNHVVDCPHCGHKHYRVITDGVVTNDRWAASQPSYPYTTTGATTFGTVYTTGTITSGTVYSSLLQRVIL